MSEWLLRNSRASRARSAFTLIEMVTAMLSATVLVAALAATVAISTDLLETPPDHQQAWNDRLLVDRLQRDLRYATAIDPEHPDGLQLIKTSAQSGATETVTYRSTANGWIREVDSGVIMHLGDASAAETHAVDLYRAPATVASTVVPHVVSTSQASTALPEVSLDLEFPKGCKEGDLLVVCLAANTPESVSLSEPGWQEMSVGSLSTLRLVVLYQTYRLTMPETLRVTVFPASVMAAAMLAIENVDSTSPIAWSGDASGTAILSGQGTHPSFAQPETMDPRQLSLQVFGAAGDPWIDAGLGMAGFTDVVQVTGGRGVPLLESTLAVLVRNGEAPDVKTRPRLYFQNSGVWLRSSACIEAVP